jgi:antitoxin (DNA-binding transcriptional repressor) of toxin-antitoxin stability system
MTQASKRSPDFPVGGVAGRFTFIIGGGTLTAMKVLPYDVLARNFPKAWKSIETNGEPVLITRNRRHVARIVPEPPPSTALEIFGDLYGMLGERAGAVLAGQVTAVRNGKRRRGTLRELRNPWAS